MKSYFKYILLIPCLVFILFFLILPLTNSIFSTFFINGSFSFNNYIEFLTDSYNLSILRRSLFISFIVTIFCIFLGLPTSYFISKLPKKIKGILLAFTLFPLLTNSVIRSFAWINILGKNGIINKIILNLHLIDKPLSILYTEFSIIVGSVYLFLPTMILTIVSVLENIDNDLFEAATTLGANNIKAFLKVIFPLALPGIIVGSTLVFTGTLTAYTTPLLLGGNRKMMLSTLLYQKANTLGDFNSASIISLVMIVITLIVISILNFIAKSMDKRGNIDA